MKNFFVSIVALISSWFGVHNQVPSTYTAPTPVVSSVQTDTANIDKQNPRRDTVVNTSVVTSLQDKNMNSGVAETKKAAPITEKILSLVPDKSAYSFGDEVVINLNPNFDPSLIASLAKISFMITKPDGTVWQNIDFMWPTREPCPGPQGSCLFVRSMRFRTAIEKAGESLQILKSGTYRISAQVENSAFKIKAETFKVDSSQVDKLILAPDVGNYVPMGYQTWSGSSYRIKYQDFYIEFDNAQQSPGTIWPYAKETIINGYNMKTYEGNSGVQLKWQSGNYWIGVYPYDIQGEELGVVKAYLQKFPPNKN